MPIDLAAENAHSPNAAKAAKSKQCPRHGNSNQKTIKKNAPAPGKGKAKSKRIEANQQNQQKSTQQKKTSKPDNAQQNPKSKTEANAESSGKYTAEVAKKSGNSRTSNINHEAHNAINYEKLKADLSEREITSVVKTTAHGLERLQERGFTSNEIVELMTNPDMIKAQTNNAFMRIKEINRKFNVIVENNKQIVTSLRGISKKSLDRLIKNYCQ